jgi:prepilin-type processing-associated H-X9-DG protein
MQAPAAPYGQEPRRGMSPWLWAAIGCGVFALLAVPVVIIAAILFPVFAQARERARAGVCVRNVRYLTIAMEMYAQDNDGRLPLAHSWSDGSYRYVKNRMTYHCPSANTPEGASSYAYNSTLNARRLRDLKYPARTPAIFESSANRWNAADPVQSFLPRHQHRGSVAYVDGHAKLATTPGAPLPLKPGDAPPAEGP